MRPPLESTDPATVHDEERWFGFVRTFLVTGFGTLAILLALIFIVDPFDSGRSPFSLISGTTDKDSRFAGASHGRNPLFNAAIFGNSHGQAISPGRLSATTGLKFVQMTVPGTTPREQLALIKWFARHHSSKAMKAVVLVVDDWWCTHDAALPTLYEFPFWLYDGGSLKYLPKLLTTQAFDRATRRVALALGLAKIDHPAGFDDYEIGASWAFRPAPAPATVTPARFDPSKLSHSFPAVERLKGVIKDYLSDVPVIAVMPYAYFTALPQPGSEKEADIANCKLAVANAINKHAKGLFIDLRIDTPLAHDPKNFMDPTHYRKSVAVNIEGKIASALASALAAK
jgi:hypothetical protein